MICKGWWGGEIMFQYFGLFVVWGSLGIGSTTKYSPFMIYLHLD